MLPHSDDTGVSPVCADPVWLPLVDAAFKKGGAAAGALLEKGACRHCPVRSACLTEALAGPEHGPWGGTSPKYRTSHGGRSASTYTNLNGLREIRGLQRPDAVA
jgi:hypothetical protein